jgi:hypothetical protein
MTQPLDTEYSAKECEFDYSLGESFRFKLPAPGLLKGLNLRLSDGKSVYYADQTGQVVFFDPSTKEEGPSAALVKRTTLLDFLRREKLDLVWWVTCSKEAFGGNSRDRGWSGDRHKTSIYWITSTGIRHKDCEQREHPSSEQLKIFLGQDGPPAASSKRRSKRDSQEG